MLKTTMYKISIALIFTVSLAAAMGQSAQLNDLRLTSLATRWDEGIPLGNGWLGALVWQKDQKLRLSLDRVDLWDDRPMPSIDRLTYKWVGEKVRLNQYDSVQKIGDAPYEEFAAPTKIPGAAMEFNINALGTVVSNILDISNGLNEIRFQNGVVMRIYIHAREQTGYFEIDNCPTPPLPELIEPAYNSGRAGQSGNSVEGQGLQRLGYPKGKVSKTGNSILYHQPTWQNNYYEVFINWKRLPNNRLTGQWTISQNKPAQLPAITNGKVAAQQWAAHLGWWRDYWSRSSVSLPDSMLQRQYELDMYKFACVARANTPPISLQAIWTADNGNLPPWKGDFHHDLNTQLSYWPGYTANHLDLTAGFTNWLWRVKAENQRWTKQYFGVEGLNVPGVTTISGKPMGGWIQYAMSPTTAAWLSQHFYWQWKYGMDPAFLTQKAFPYLNAVKTYFENLLHLNPGKGLPLSSSPEYHDNSIKAWFTTYTNYDLALMKQLFENWQTLSTAYFKQTGRGNPAGSKPPPALPGFDVNETGLTVAAGQNLEESHRHLSPYMAIYPLQLIGNEDSVGKNIFHKSLNWIGLKGTRNWVGYSFAWAACLYARAAMGDSAAGMLQKFAANFCSSNSFHLNGDQKGGQYSSFTYRPFTLEGNFAFAQGVHEMMVQTKNKTIVVFPAVPRSWKTISFSTLRTEGAFLVSAKMENGTVSRITVRSTAGGRLRLKIPFENPEITGISRQRISIINGIGEMTTTAGQEISFRNPIR